MSHLRLYGFVIVGIFAALLLAWLLDSGIFWIFLVVLAIAAFWLGRQCIAIDRRLQAMHRVGDRLMQLMARRGQLAEQLFEVAVKFDDGDRLDAIAFAGIDEKIWLRRSVQAIDGAVREALRLMEERALVGEQPAFLQQKQRLLEKQAQIHQICQQFNQEAQTYNAARETRPAVWLELQLAFPTAPTLALTDELMVAQLDKFARAESPFWRDLLKVMGGAILLGWREARRSAREAQVGANEMEGSGE